jgi:hypothetical protein
MAGKLDGAEDGATVACDPQQPFGPIGSNVGSCPNPAIRRRTGFHRKV